MWQLYVFSFLAGVFAANGVPHFVRGVIGQKHQTPFGKASSAVLNVAWGWLNFVVAAIFLHFGHVRTHEYRAFMLVAIGGLAMGLVNAYAWSHQPDLNKKH
jgi:hypothetical protein